MVESAKGNAKKPNAAAGATANATASTANAAVGATGKAAESPGNAAAGAVGKAAAAIGKVAPNFKLASSAGDSFELKSLRGKKVVLYFYPKDMTTACTQQACDFRDATVEIEGLNAVVVGISMDNVATHQRFIAKYGLPFILLEDKDHKVCEKYGVWQLKKLYGREYMGIVRSTFLIDEKGKLVREWRNIRVKGHIAEVLQAAKDLG